jgi:hypothetical protein
METENAYKTKSEMINLQNLNLLSSARPDRQLVIVCQMIINKNMLIE